MYRPRGPGILVASPPSGAYRLSGTERALAILDAQDWLQGDDDDDDGENTGITPSHARVVLVAPAVLLYANYFLPGAAWGAGLPLKFNVELILPLASISLEAVHCTYASVSCWMKERPGLPPTHSDRLLPAALRSQPVSSFRIVGHHRPLFVCFGSPEDPRHGGCFVDRWFSLSSEEFFLGFFP